MQSTRRAVAPAPPIQAQRSSTVADAGAFSFTRERSLFTSETTKPYIPRRNGSSSLFRVKGRRGPRQFYLHLLTCAAVAAFAMVYLLLRCSVQLRGSKNFRRPKGIPRSLSAVEAERGDPVESCVLWGVGESTLPAVGGEHLDEEQLLERARHYAFGVAETMEESRSVLLQLGMPLAAKVFTVLLRWCVLELAALCSLLDPRRRDFLEQAVDNVMSKLAWFVSFVGRSRKYRGTMRHMRRLRGLLLELPKMDFDGSRLSRVDRRLELAQLLSLQQVALEQLQWGVYSLSGWCAQTRVSLIQGVIMDYLDDFNKTAELRMNQVFTNGVISRWLRQKHREGTHHGLLSPKVMRSLAATPAKPHDDLLRELHNTPLALRLQQRSSGTPEQASVQADAQSLGAPLATAVHAEPVATTPSPPKGFSSPEAPAQRGQPTDAGRPVDQSSESSDSSAGPAPSESLGLAWNVRAPAETGAGVASWTSTLAPLPGPHVPREVSLVPDLLQLPTYHWPSMAPTASQASSSSGVHLPWSSVGGLRQLAFSGPSITWHSAEVVAGFGNSELAGNNEQELESEYPSPQVTRQLETHRTALTNASAEPPASSTSAWAIGDAGEASAWRRPQAQPPNVPHAWRGGASEEQTGLQAIDETRPADPANQGRPGNHAPGPPVLQPMFPSGPSGSFPQMQSSAQQYSSGESPFDVSRASDIWGFNGPSTGQGAIQSLSEGSGMRADLSTGSSRWSLPVAQSGLSSRWHRGSDRPWPPFRGVAVGEPVEGASEEDSAPAAHVAVTLFSSTSVDLSGGLHQPNAASR